MKRLKITAWLAVHLFLAISAVSHFIRSDGQGISKVEDGSIRVGYPFLMFERGGFAFHEHISPLAIIGNVLVALAVAAAFVFAGAYVARVRRV